MEAIAKVLNNFQSGNDQNLKRLEDYRNKATPIALTSISKEYKCKHGCKDVGFFIDEDERGHDVARRCQCLIDEMNLIKYNRLHIFAEMPEQLKEMKIKDYMTDIYVDQQNKDLALKAKKIATSFVLNYETMKERQTGLYFYSETKGSGKTRLAIAIGNALIERHGETVKFCTTTTLIDEIKATFTSKAINSGEYLEAIKMVNVLILDDIGTEKLSDWVNETFYSIINDRMLNKRITIYTSNCTIDELKHDGRIKSRIEGTTYPVKCPEEDIRVKLKKCDNADIENLLLGLEP